MYIHAHTQLTHARVHAHYTHTHTHTYKDRITNPGIPSLLALLLCFFGLLIGPFSLQFPGQAHVVVKLNVYNNNNT